MTSRNRFHSRLSLMICAALLLAGAGFANAGDLNPPVGPVAPTQRTPINANMTPGDADSLFKITQPGSYYLTGNITGGAARHGIEIAANGVTLDLNGFDLLGVAGSLDGVSVTAAGRRNIAVINGAVRTWGGDGVDLETASAVNCRLANLLANGNSGNGIATGTNSTVTGCTASSNGGAGIAVGIGCTVTNSSSHQNTGAGIIASNGCIISTCTTANNGGNGIQTGSSTVSICTAYQNGGDGVLADSCSVTSCKASSNTGNGINAGAGSTVTGCATRFNTLDGIRCMSGSVILGNNCASDGANAGSGAGIHAIQGDNRIEGNNCTFADRGIDVDAAGNIIIRNTCSSNTVVQWDIAIGNAVAPIVAATTNGAAISGSTYAGSLGSTDPNANFTY